MREYSRVGRIQDNIGDSNIQVSSNENIRQRKKDPV